MVGRIPLGHFRRYPTVYNESCANQATKRPPSRVGVPSRHKQATQNRKDERREIAWREQRGRSVSSCVVPGAVGLQSDVQRDPIACEVRNLART